jgi:hypothetical protein
MSEAPDQRYESRYHNAPLSIVGLGVISLAAAAAWASAAAYLSGDALVWAKLEVAGVSVALCVVLFLASRSHRAWRITDQGLSVREVPSLRWAMPVKEHLFPYSAIAAVRRVDSGGAVVLELETSGGVRHSIMRARIRDKVGAWVNDIAGFEAFASDLRARISAAGAAGVTFQDGLGFWNKSAGLALLGALFLSSVAGAIAIVHGVLAGTDAPQGIAMQGLALIILSPFGFGYALYRSWSRRRFVLGLDSLRRQIVVKE